MELGDVVTVTPVRVFHRFVELRSNSFHEPAMRFAIDNRPLAMISSRLNQGEMFLISHRC